MTFIDPTTVILRDGQFMINGVRFGKWTNAPVSEVDWGGYDISENLAENSRMDGLVFGSEFAQGSSVTMNGGFINDVRTAHRELASAWSSRQARQSAGTVTQLFYQRDGETRFLVGRPRRFYANLLRTKASFATFDMDFQRSSPLSYGSIIQYSLTSNAKPTVIDNSSMLLGDGPMPIRISYEPGLSSSRFVIRKDGQPIVDFNIYKVSQALEVASSFPGELYVKNGAGNSIRGFLNPLTTKLGELYLEYDEEHEYTVALESSVPTEKVTVNVELLSSSWGL